MLKIQSLNVYLQKQTALRILRVKKRFEIKMRLLQESSQNI